MEEAVSPEEMEGTVAAEGEEVLRLEVLGDLVLAAAAAVLREGRVSGTSAAREEAELFAAAAAALRGEARFMLEPEPS